MPRKLIKHPDDSQESWNDETGLYVHIDADGVEIESRSLTPEECTTLDPGSPQLRDLTEVVNQLILDALMGGM